MIAAWPEYWVYRVTLGPEDRILAADFAILWVAAVLLLVLPAVSGTLVGRAYVYRDERSRWQQEALRWTIGPQIAPRAWDDFFSERPSTYLRVRTVDGTTHAGLFANGLGEKRGGYSGAEDAASVPPPERVPSAYLPASKTR